jgi:DNA-binding transcriptional MerR regulator
MIVHTLFNDMREQDARYRIHTVAEMTGVPAATLRSWERRYGVPRPARTEAAYRLYDDRDIELVRRMRDLCGQGLAASEAASLVLSGPSGDAGSAQQNPSRKLSTEIVDAALAFDVPLLQQRFSTALTLADAVTVHEGVISPALRRMGELWQAGRASVAQEHLLASASEQALRDLLRLVQPAEARAVALLACLPTELHHLGLYGVALRLANLGVRSVLLGARTPTTALAEAVARLAPTLVGLSVTMPPPEDSVEGLVAELRAAVGETPWLIGGAGVAAVADAATRAGARVIRTWPNGIRDAVTDILHRQNT